jgi:hypothetical protein
MFQLGDAILVAPVVEPGATTREVTLPPGEWIDWWTGEPASGTFTAPAPLTRMPMWRKAGTFVPMFALPADTLEPVAAPGVTSYAYPDLGGELRLLLTGDTASIGLHDSTIAFAEPGQLMVVIGSTYTITTFDLTVPAGTTVPLMVAADEAALQTCSPPGCWLLEGTRLRVRVHGNATVNYP